MYGLADITRQSIRSRSLNRPSDISFCLLCRPTGSHVTLCRQQQWSTDEGVHLFISIIVIDYSDCTPNFYSIETSYTGRLFANLKMLIWELGLFMRVEYVGSGESVSCLLRTFHSSIASCFPHLRPRPRTLISAIQWGSRRHDCLSAFSILLRGHTDSITYNCDWN